MFEGSVSDRSLTEACGLLEKLERGDSVRADKGFNSQEDMLVPIGVRLNIPPMKQGDKQMTPHDLVKTKKIAAVRIHVERKMQQLKYFELRNQIDNSLFDIIDPLVVVTAVLTNFQPALVM